MRFHLVIRYIGMALLLNAIFMLVSIVISAYNNFDTGFFPLLMSFVLTCTLGLFPLIYGNQREMINKKEGYAIVVGSWVFSCFVGILPYILWGGEFTIVNAIFESVSGYTTTGSTILKDIEILPKSLLFWRSSTHLIGGAGVVIFALALVPIMGKSRMPLASVEMSAFARDSVSFRIQKAIRIIVYVYVIFVVVLTFLLKAAGMDWFDAVNHSFSTIATGGFSTKNASIAYFNSLSIELILIVFMLLSSTNFTLLYTTFTTKKNNVFKSEVARYFYLSFFISTIVVAISLWYDGFYSFFESLRLGAFQVASIVTTTGFATIDTNNWTPLAIIILIFLTLQSGCAGSTAGGAKADRILIKFKTLKAQFTHLQHPNAIVKIKFSNLKTDNELIFGTLTFMLLYLLTIFAGTVFAAACGVDLVTAFTANATCISNTGPGFGEVSSMSNYSGLPSAVKCSLSVVMLAGRLELFGFFQLFLLASWK